MKVSQAALVGLSLIWSLGEESSAFVPHNMMGSKRGFIMDNIVEPYKRRSTAIFSEESTNRRDMMFKGVALPFVSLVGKSQEAAAAPTAATKVEDLLADLPMVRLRLPPQGLGREYVAIKLKIQGLGPFDFMVDSGLTTELVTPHLQQTLGIGGSKTMLKGIGAGGEAAGGALVELEGASLCCGNFNNGQSELQLPLLHAVVTDFPQEHIDPAHDPVEGMLGMEMLRLFDVEFDFPKNRLRLWKAGTFSKDPSRAAGLVEIPAAVLNETGLIGIRIISPKNPEAQPVLGFLDCGSTFSAMNWAAAGYLGLPSEQDVSYQKTPKVVAVGVDGRPQQLPTRKVQLSYVGDVARDPSTGGLVFEQPPSNWKQWDATQIAIGDLPAFSEILGDGRTPFRGPAALIGLDILAQRRVVLETGQGRGRRLWVSPK